MIVNGIYDPKLFGLRFTDDPEQPNDLFWSSAIRPATINPETGDYVSGGTRTTEYLEIDYGRVRQVMGLMLDIMRLPFSITIEYDAISTDDENHKWVEVTPESGLRFDDLILYEANATSSFVHSEFYFSNAVGEMVHTRYLRIGFTRRDVPWPTRANLGNPYPAVVKNLRTFRSVSDHRHMAGPLIASDRSGSELVRLNVRPDYTTHELTQRFIYPEGSIRGEGTTNTDDDIVPSLLGFSFLTEIEMVDDGYHPSTMQDESKWRWSLWDVTNDDEVKLDQGLTVGAANSGKCWIDCYFNRPIEGDTNKMYEIRLSSRFTQAASSIYINRPTDIPGFKIPTTLTAKRRSKLFVVDNIDIGTGILRVGDYIQAIDGLNSYQVRSIGQAGGYISFDGFSGRIDIDYDAALNTNNWSVALWYRRDADTMDGVESVIIDNSSYSGDGWRLGIGPDGGSLSSALQVTCDGTTIFDVINTADSEWHHAFATFDNATGTLKLFRDGIEVGSATGLTYTANSTDPMCIGTKWGTDWDNLLYGSGPWTDPGTRYEGNVDDVAIFNDDMSPAEVADIFDLGHGGSAGVADMLGYTDLVAFYQLNDDISSTVATDSHGSYDGTVQPSGASFTGEAIDQVVIEVNRGWREPNGSREFFIVPRLTYVAGGQRVDDYAGGLALRVWADVGDSGRDILGNEYRYATRLLDSASRVLDPESNGWMSAPRPSPEAVESLYFDVRQTQGTGQKEFAVVDNIRIAPRTHGVRMHVYYTRDNLHGEAPKLTDHWDQMLWIPVNEVYELRRDEVIQLPYGLRASYIKLEFTNLRPMPFSIPPFPELPPVEFKRHPTWVENAFENTKLRTVVEDWFVQTSTPVQRRIMQEISNPIQEFAYKHREFMTALSHGLIEDSRLIGSGLVDSGTGVFIDPVTSSKIRLSSNTMFRGSLLATIRDSSILGTALRSRSTTIEPFLRESQPAQEARSPFVSTRGDRVTHSFSALAETPMWFNRKCRHFYRKDKARFNRKAYFVGIRDVEFRRNDYTVDFDDPIISDDLYDDTFLDLNSFSRNPMTRIENAQTVFVSYKIGTTQYTDELVLLNDFDAVDLQGAGEIATEITVMSGANETGVRYEVDIDFSISHAYDADGDVKTQISRSDATEYLEVDASALSGITFRDSGIAVGEGTPVGSES